MKAENMYSPYEIEVEIVDDCPLRDNILNFFQIVYIVKGRGQQWVNDHKAPYQSGDLLLLIPEDKYSFDVEETTEFLFIKFNNFYLHDKKLGTDSVHQLEYILNNTSLRIGCVINSPNDKKLVESLTRTISDENRQQQLYSNDMVQQLINTLIMVIARNIAIHLPEKIKASTDTKVGDILQYIQSNIYQPEQLRLEVIAKHLGFSETYISRFFKKHTDETIQQYATHYRMNLIENRLKYSDMRIGEIAFEFGFNDESHLNKFVRKQKNLAPTEFRRS
ncbi:AraC family transcriptional regulator [Flavobacterium sp. HSC-61S13]|uniref:AraC family transcriptional regulator n=1 Tax=Flavobacterium sp. HSC-61S13 TaxID=2910963 RepID=UPI0020A044B6|nr:AraC family transcriptional regulator [Flavobacterium sp. HSC-61S13]MCP1996099.1 AraC-like DNA-binding protein [Flavobacterium sp. HSC-61S13]